jgi:hypothetical protein
MVPATSSGAIDDDHGDILHGTDAAGTQILTESRGYDPPRINKE